jgi:hypothetical protein
MLAEILQIKKWFKENTSGYIKSGSYSIPVNNEKWLIDVIDNKIVLKDIIRKDMKYSDII